MSRYLVALMTGGLMESPKLEADGKEIIEAGSKEEAEAIYNKKHNCSFYYGLALASMEDGVLAILHPQYVTYGDAAKL